MAKRSPNRYAVIIEDIFRAHFRKGKREFSFDRSELETAAQAHGIELPKNLGDLIYSFRHRTALPTYITQHAPPGEEWVIRGKGKSKYQFALTDAARILPNAALATIKIPDATPSIIEKYALGDEQALLAKVRYNRLLDIFTGVTCYSLQNHLRTTAKGLGQIEIDELYVGVDRHGAQFVLPVQAKGGRDQIGVVQIEQDVTLCRQRFPDLVCRPIAAQFLSHSVIAMMELTQQEGRTVVFDEKHYELVESSAITAEDLQAYSRFHPPVSE